MTEEEQICIECQECCKTLAVPYYTADNDTIEFYSIRGCERVINDQGAYLLIPFSCPHLIEDGCDIYEDRPEVCREYDGRKVLFMKDKCKLGNK